MKRRGVTLLEVLAALALAAMLATALATAYSAVVRYQLRAPQNRTAHLQQISFEDRLRSLLQRAFVDDDAANTNSYFIGRVDESGGGPVNDSGATELIFTALGTRPSGATLDTSEELSFEERNTRWGPHGGPTELRIGLTPLGDAGSRTGLFLREQTPPDDDVDQGGYESLVDDRVTSLSFEFWDGEDWQTEWDTRNGSRRLPAAVRVAYNLSGDDVQHVMIVRLDGSDVTTANPATGVNP